MVRSKQNQLYIPYMGSQIHQPTGPAGLHLGNDSRGGKIRFYESKGGQWCKDPCA